MLGYTFLAIVFILDKLIVTKSVSKPVVYTFYSTIIMFEVLLVWPFVGFGMLSGIDWLWAVISGVAFGLALWTFYKAIKKGETSHISPFNGAFITIFIYIIAQAFLKESLTAVQVVGMIILIFASLLLSFEKTRGHHGWHTGFLWAILSALFFAISHTTAKYLYINYDFGVALVWSKSTVGLVGLVTLFFPSVRAVFKKKKKQAKTVAKRYAGLIVFADKFLSIIANLLIQYAMAIGSVTLVGAMSGLQFVLMFVFIFLLTKFLPKVFKEYFTKNELIVQTIAIVLVALGSALFVL